MITAWTGLPINTLPKLEDEGAAYGDDGGADEEELKKQLAMLRGEKLEAKSREAPPKPANPFRAPPSVGVPDRFGQNVKEEDYGDVPQDGYLGRNRWAPLSVTGEVR